MSKEDYEPENPEEWQDEGDPMDPNDKYEEELHGALETLRGCKEFYD